MLCSLAVEVHTANCTTDGTLDVTCTHPAVPSNVSLVVDNVVWKSMESYTGVTRFSLPYPDSVNASGSCHVIHSSDIHTSTFINFLHDGK